MLSLVLSPVGVVAPRAPGAASATLSAAGGHLARGSSLNLVVTDTAEAVAQRLNARFAAAGPSNNLTEAGVLIHMMDKDDQAYDESILVWGGPTSVSGSFATNTRPWDPSSRCDAPLWYTEMWANGANTTSRTYCDRWSATLVPPRSRSLFNDMMGVVLGPEHAMQHLMCAYAGARAACARERPPRSDAHE